MGRPHACLPFRSPCADPRAAPAAALSGDRLDWAYHLLETNMRAMYERAWGWSDEQKRGELESPKACTPLPRAAATRRNCQPWRLPQLGSRHGRSARRGARRI